MKIVVCIKQVPSLTAMQFDAATKTLKREGVRSEVSAFDVRAVLKAVELRNAHGGEVVVVTMGPPQARAALVDCLALGADRAVHLNDRAFAGADTLATAQALAETIGREPFDLILCGRNSTDAETGQVGPELAELLDLPQVSAVRRLEIDEVGRTLMAERETDDACENLRCPLPALVTVGEDVIAERFASKAEKAAAANKPIEEVTAAQLGGDPSRFGKSGSPTRVAGLQAVEEHRRGEILDASDPAAAVERLAGRLAEAGLFGSEKREDAGTGGGAAEFVARKLGTDILVVAETGARGLRRVSLELLSKARSLAAQCGGRTTVLLFGENVREAASELVAAGAPRILLCEDPRSAAGTEPAAALLESVIRRETPGIVLLPATALGRDVAPRVAARLRLGLTGDCIDLSFDEEGRLLQHKPAFGGQIVAPILSDTVPEMATVRPGMLAAAPAPPCASPEMVEVPLPPHRGRVQLISRQPVADPGAALDSAEVVVGVGAGIGGPENLPPFRELARELDAALCTTRDVADRGWLPRQLQVGLTGRAIAPKLYLAFGVRGAFEHTVGVRRAGVVVAVNKNAKAPIFKSADYGIVAEWQVVLPLLMQRLRGQR